MEHSTHWHNLKPSYIREILQAAQADGVISLAGGLPAPDLLPNGLFNDLLSDLPADVYQYASTEGESGLREYLAQVYQLNEMQDVIITSGSQQGLDLIARTFLDHRFEIVMEQPCYLGALQVFQLSGCKIHSISQQSDGPDLNQLEQLFKTRPIKMFYAVPDFHNPTGICWSEHHRYEVAALCQRYNVILIEDAPYRELRFTGAQLPTLNEICPERTLTLRSFSKILSPGIRLGTITGPTPWLKAIIKLKQAADLHTATPFQRILPGILESERFKKHLSVIRDRYHKNHDTLINALSDIKEMGHSLSPVSGGMFLWLQLNELNATELSERLLKQGLAVVPGKHFYPAVNSDSAVRLNFSHSNTRQLIKAAEILSNTLLNDH